MRKRRQAARAQVQGPREGTHRFRAGEGPSGGGRGSMVGIIQRPDPVLLKTKYQVKGD